MRKNYIALPFVIFVMIVSCNLFDKVPPGEVGNFVVTAGDGKVTLSWTNPVDDDFDHVEIWYGEDENNLVQFTGTINNAGTEITGLTNGVKYYFKIVTVDTNGNISNGILKEYCLFCLSWSKTYGGSNNDWARSIIETSDGGFAVAGVTSSSDGDVSNNHGGDDSWIIRLNSDGELLWEKSYGGSGNDFVYSIIKTSDGGFAVAGATSSSDGDVSNNQGGEDFWIIKIAPTE